MRNGFLNTQILLSKKLDQRAKLTSFLERTPQSFLNKVLISLVIKGCADQCHNLNASPKKREKKYKNTESYFKQLS